MGIQGDSRNSADCCGVLVAAGGRPCRGGVMDKTTQTTTDLWTYRDAGTLGTDVGRGGDLTGFSVEATDGGIGKIDEATYDTSQSYIVVDTGPWIFAKKVMLPAGVIH